jgi:hypothetical protein
MMMFSNVFRRIMILGLFISTLGSSFVESWIDKKERKSKILESTDNGRGHTTVNNMHQLLMKQNL